MFLTPFANSRFPCLEFKDRRLTATSVPSGNSPCTQSWTMTTCSWRHQEHPYNRSICKLPIPTSGYQILVLSPPGPELCTMYIGPNLPSPIRRSGSNWFVASARVSYDMILASVFPPSTSVSYNSQQVIHYSHWKVQKYESSTFPSLFGKWELPDGVRSLKGILRPVLALRFVSQYPRQHTTNRSSKMTAPPAPT